jgi:plastocyanin
MISKMKRPAWLSLSIAIAAMFVVGCGRPVVETYETNGETVEEIRASLAKASAAGGGGAKAAGGAKATGWATLKGRFTYDGAPPKPKPINADKDQAVCTKHPLVDESLVVGSDKGLANVVLFVRDPGVEVHPDLAAAPKEPTVLDNSGCRFEPHIAMVRTGQTLQVKNSDPVSHNTKADLQNNSAFNDSITPGKALAKQLTEGEAAPMPVSCTMHQWMKGYVLVQPHPYMAVSAKDGTFEIKNVPAGVPLEFQLWHEAAKPGDHSLVLEGAELKTEGKGRFKVTLEPNEVRDLKEIKVPADKLSAG